MRTLYRVENKYSKNGPYVYKGRHGWGADINKQFSVAHPYMGDDHKLMEQLQEKSVGYYQNDWGTHLFPDDTVFAFSSMEQLEKWFCDHEEIDELHKRNFWIAVYEVHEECCAIGDTQCVFDRNMAKRVKIISLETLALKILKAA